LGRRQYAGRNGLEVVVETDDDVLDDQSTHQSLASALATAKDERAAEAIVLQHFRDTHEVDNAATDRSFLRRTRGVTIKMRRRPTRIWT
jgi:hypothetical protein